MKIIIEPLQIVWEAYIRIIPIGFIPELSKKLGNLERCQWSRSLGWHVLKTNENWRKLKECFGTANIEVRTTSTLKTAGQMANPFNEAQQEALLKTQEKLTIKRYSLNTCRAYLQTLSYFFQFYKDQNPEIITEEQIISYLKHGILEKKWKESTQNSQVNAIKFYFEKVLGKPAQYYPFRPRKAEHLPGVLSQEEVVALFKATTNLKHRTILMLIDAAGLRLSELTNLRIDDLHFDRMQVFIKAGKGKKDRYSLLSKQLMPVLKANLKTYHPSYWLFEGQEHGQYANRSVQAILRQSGKASGKNPIVPYTPYGTPLPPTY